MNHHRGTRRIEAELTCMHCARVVGRLSRRQDTPGAPLEFHDPAGGAALTVRRITDLRCANCGGPIYPEESERRYVEPPLDLGDEEDERPRRGRPPKSLIELRRAAEAEPPGPEAAVAVRQPPATERRAS